MDDEMLEKTYAEMQWQPDWAQAWEASNGLCEFLAEKDLSGLRVLDLGCGLGITTALLLAAGANVISGDNAPPALEFTKLNTWRWRERCDIRTIDWNKSVIETPFDLIIGSDILYDRADIVPLDRFFRRHLTPGGYVILADPSRAMTREFLDKFAELGWKQTTTMIELKQTKFPSRIVEMRP
jgi:predicted nicotinamide N-methyase